VSWYYFNIYSYLKNCDLFFLFFFLVPQPGFSLGVPCRHCPKHLLRHCPAPLVELQHFWFLLCTIKRPQFWYNLISSSIRFINYNFARLSSLIPVRCPAQLSQLHFVRDVSSILESRNVKLNRRVITCCCRPQWFAQGTFNENKMLLPSFFMLISCIDMISHNINQLMHSLYKIYGC